MLVILFIVLIGFWIYYSDTRLIKTYENVLDSFDSVNTEFVKRHNWIDKLLSETTVIENIENSILDNVNNLKAECINLGTNIEFIDRRIAFENEITSKIFVILNILNQRTEDYAKHIRIDYKNVFEDLKNEAEDYNNLASKLREYLNVFPTSLTAHFHNIKHFDYIKLEEQ